MISESHAHLVHIAVAAAWVRVDATVTDMTHHRILKTCLVKHLFYNQSIIIDIL